MKITSNDKHYSLNGTPIYIYANDYTLAADRYYLPMDKISIQPTDCGYTCVINAVGCQSVTIVVPTCDRRIIVGDEYEYTDTVVTHKFYYNGPTALLNSEKTSRIYSSIVHLIGENDAWSCSVFGECLISCCRDAYEQYVEITGIPDNESITFYIDKSSNHRVNLQRQSIDDRVIQYYDLLDIDEMKSAIYHRAKLESLTLNVQPIVEKIQYVQSLFDKVHLYSVITGSFAEQLNGINCSVKDCDFMFKDKAASVYAEAILSDEGYVKNNDGTISKNADVKIDLSYDNYNLLASHPKHIKESYQLRFFDLEGLMWLSLLNCYEFHRTPYPYYYRRNDRALFELTQHASKQSLVCNSAVGEEIRQISSYMPNCVKICKEMNGLPMIFEDTRINEPFRTNCFGTKDVRTFPVINLGAAENFRLITEFPAKKAKWSDVSGVGKKCNIQPYHNFTMLLVEDVGLPGVLMCQ